MPVDERCRPIVEEFLLGLDAALPDLVDKVYVTGSALTDDWSPRSDVDTVIVVKRPVTEDDAPTLSELHAATKGEHCVDGLYLTEPELFTGPDQVASAPHVVDGGATCCPTGRRSATPRTRSSPSSRPDRRSPATGSSGSPWARAGCATRSRPAR